MIQLYKIIYYFYAKGEQLQKSILNIRIMTFKLEICADSIGSAITAQDAGADRIELCSALTEGGITPSYGTISAVRNNVTIDMNVIIRPRGGDFLYTGMEYDIMRREIESCGEWGVDGIVLGILTSEGRIDVDRTARLIGFARPMTVTFHRAFDMCADPMKGLEDVIAAGADRLLTSGQKEKAGDGLDLITRLVEKAGRRIIIMPGSGINSSNIREIAYTTKAGEYHLTGRKIIESEMIFRREGVTMSTAIPGMSEFERKVTDREEIRRIISILNEIKID